MKKSYTLTTKLILAFRNIFKRHLKHKDNYSTFKKSGYTTFLSLLLFAMSGFNQNASAQTTLAAGDIAVIGYNSNGAPDNFAILFLKNLSAGTVFYINDNEVSTEGGTSFDDLNEGEASFTVKAGQTITAGTVVVLPWGGAAVSTTTYDFSSTSSFGLGNNNEEIYIYTASSITSITPTTFIYFVKIGSSTASVPSGLTSGTTAIAPTGSGSRYKTTGATYSGNASQLLAAIGNTATNWNGTGATSLAASDWTFTVTTCIPPTVVTPTSNGPVCAGNTLNLFATANGTPMPAYQWSGPDGFASGFQNPSISSATTAATGVYTVFAVNSCGSTSSSVSATINSLPTSTITPDGPTTFCSGGSVNLAASASSSYLWSTGVTTSGISVNTTGTFTVTVTNANGCTASTSATTTVNPLPTPSISGTLAFCSGNTTTLDAGSYSGYNWSTGASTQTISVNTAANYTVTVTNANGCTASTSVTTIVNALPTPSISATLAFCSGSSTTLDAGSYSDYNWSTGASTQTISVSTSATFTVTVTNANGCSASTSATTTVNALPTVSISGTLSFCTGSSTILDAGVFASYNWSTGASTQTISVNTAGTFTVTVTNAGGCSASASVSTTVISAPAQPSNFTTSSATVNAGQSGVVYTVPNDPTATSYNWSYSGTGATINGTTNSVTLNFSIGATSGTLSVTATNNCGTSTARTIAVTVLPLPGTMRITEYMYNGGGAGGAGEFVEFTNVGSTTVDMAGWSFDDNSRVPGSQSLTSFGIVQPGESVILTELNAGTFRTNWNLCAGVKVIGGNANNLGREDEINLYDASNNLVDRLTYGDQTFSPGSIRTTLKSGWVSAAGLGANNITQWTLSLVADAENSFTSTLAEIGSPGKSTHATVAFNPCIIVNGAPTIVINVTTTNNYLDGGVLVSPPSPYGLSGVINDITDPASTLGIDFTIGDDITPVGSLTFTVASSNLTVVPNANVILTGSGASKNLKITPAAVGYSNITVTVNDGTNNTSYVINYAASDPSPNIIPANTFWHTGMSDGSDAIALDNSYYISGDDELNILNVYSRAASGLPFASYNYTSNLALPDPSKPEVDVEAATRSTANANKVYWTGSMSNGKTPFDNKPNRDRLFATTVTGTGSGTSVTFSGYVNIRTALLAWGDANGYNFTASAAAGVDSKALNGFSLEGMVFGPDNTTMYLGLRAPLVPTTFRHNAVIAPILNFEAWFNNGSPSGPPTFGPPIELDLNITGIRDIIRLSNGTYIILSGSPIDQGGVNHMYKWTGNPADAPVEVITSAANLLNWEGMMQVNDSTGGSLSLSKLQIVSDGGAQILYQDNNEAKDFGDLNLRKFRTDVITGLDLNICSGFTASITQGGNTALCTGDSVTLTATAGSGNSYSWSTGATTQIIKIGIGGSGTYTVTVTNANGCVASQTKTVTVTKALPSDFNGDNVTNNIDFLQLLGKFNQSCTCPEDLNHDGVVNNFDFLILLGEFNHICGGGSFQ